MNLRPRLTSKSAVWVGGSGRSADWGSLTALSSAWLANKNVSTFSIGRGKYLRTACSNNLQISSASADEFVFTGIFLHANGGDDVEGNEMRRRRRKRTHYVNRRG